MKIGEHYRPWAIDKAQWRKAAKEWQFDQDFVINRLCTVSGKLKKAALANRSGVSNQGIEEIDFWVNSPN